MSSIDVVKTPFKHIEVKLYICLIFEINNDNIFHDDICIVFALGAELSQRRTFIRKNRIHQLRARRALSLFKAVPLRTRRALSLYKVYRDSALLVLNGTSLNNANVLLALSRR